MNRKLDEKRPMTELASVVRRVDLVITESQTAQANDAHPSGRIERSWAVTLAFPEPTDGWSAAQLCVTPEQEAFLRAIESFLSSVRGCEEATPNTVSPSVDCAEVSSGNLAAASRCRLSPRQAQVLEHVLAGHPNKETALKLMISRRTVEHHRAAVMQKTGARSVPELIRIVGGLAATGS